MWESLDIAWPEAAWSIDENLVHTGHFSNDPARDW